MKMATIDELVSKYPRLFHMAESGSWQNIQKYGLLSTTALLNLFEVPDPPRSKIESEQRTDSVPVQHPEYGIGVIRDQKPMPLGPLKKCLVGMTPKEWFELLNSKTFFWPTQERLGKLLNGVQYKKKSHDVLTVDTRKLIERHRDKITLSPINSGFAIFGKPKRGKFTFKGIDEYPAVHRKGDVAEVAVAYQVPDIEDLTLSVDRWRGDDWLETIWKPEADNT